MHLLLKLFLKKRHFGLNCLHAQTFIFERITINEWAPTTNKPKLFTTHILPSIRLQTTFWKQQQYAIATIVNVISFSQLCYKNYLWKCVKVQIVQWRLCGCPSRFVEAFANHSWHPLDDSLKYQHWWWLSKWWCGH